MVKSEARSQRIPLLWVDSLSGGLPLESRAPGWEEARATCRGHVEASRVTAWDPRMSMGAGPSLATSTGHQPPGRWILAALQPKSRYSVMLQTRMSKFQYQPPQRWPSAPARGQAAAKTPRVFPGLPGAYTATS